MAGAIKVIDTSIKLNIAIEAQKNPTASVKDLSSQFNVSESTVKRAKKDFAEEAAKILALPVTSTPVPLEAVREVAQQLILAPVTEAPVDTTPPPVAAVSPAVAISAPTAAADFDRRRGYRDRNGRMDIIRDVANQMGLDSPTKDLYTRVNEVAAERGVNPIGKPAFYVLICEVRKAAKVAAQATAGA